MTESEKFLLENAYGFTGFGWAIERNENDSWHAMTREPRRNLDYIRDAEGGAVCYHTLDDAVNAVKNAAEGK